MKASVRDRLIVGLDVETAREARELFARLRDHAGMFKIGSQLFTAAGPGIVREMLSAGARIFLDLKYHDIPNTVAGAGIEAARLGVSIFNVHALGGGLMMRRAREAVHEVSEREGLKRPAIIAVTALTSADNATLEEVGITGGALALVLRLARLAEACGLDGVVASPGEITMLRDQLSAPNFLIVTPGVRPLGSATDDQKRVMTPAEAIRAGADYLVISRPILKAPEPERAVIKVLEEMEQAYSQQD
ncbi:MAG TPA: orotidine-5'-phosphate decarboxylase [Pyrinomonadaceae bacterium]|jgi:orotidine-5'-phosphate decarboxylase